MSKIKSATKIFLVGIMGLMGVMCLPAAQLWLNRGNAANDDTGDTPRDFLAKCNTNFTEIYAATRVLTNLPSMATLWVQTNGVGMEPSTVETSLITNGLTLATAGTGSLMIGSNAWLGGRTLHLVAAGSALCNDVGNAVITWKIGSVVVLSNLPAATSANGRWRFEGRVTFRSTGTSATAYGSGWACFSTNGLIPLERSSVINTTTNNTMHLAWRHSLDSANNSVNCDQVVIRAEY